MRRYELEDKQWQKIADLFPSSKGKRGGQWQNHRNVLNGMLWILCSGAPWRDLPERFGKWNSVYRRFRRWAQEDIWQKIFQALQEPDLDWLGAPGS